MPEELRRLNRKFRLRRCPYCGSKAVIEKHGFWFYVRCAGAFHVTPKPTKDVAICEIQPRTPGCPEVADVVRMWNRRRK